MNIYSKETTVPFFGVDQSDTLTIASTFDLFQEAAINHAEMLGVGREALKQSGQVWIISRLSVFMARRPRFGENVTIRTWPRSSHKLFAIRDYDIHFSDDIADNKNGPCRSNVLVRGRSAWLVVDLEKRRPLRPQTVVETMPANEGINALPCPAQPEGNDPPPSLTGWDCFSAPVLRRACYSDIDFNGHVNNTRYIQWIQDLTDPEILEQARQIRLDINYLAEVRYGETISLFTAPIAESCPGLKEGPDTPDNLMGPCTAAFAIEGRRTSLGSPASTGSNKTVPVFRAELRTR